MPQPLKMVYEQDAPLDALRGKTVAVVGFGSQGHAHSQNLRDSGVKVIVANRKDSPNGRLAVEKGFNPVSVEEAVKAGDLIIVTLPDEVQPEVYNKSIAPNLKAVHQNATGNARNVGLAWARGIGGARSGVIETTFKDECETDLFGEQAVLCGGLSALIKAGFETLIEAGYPPEMAYFECVHEVKLIVDLIYVGGLDYMRYSISNTAEYGDLTRGPRIVDQRTKAEMKKILAEITSGQFAKEWRAEYEGGMKNFKRLYEQDNSHPVEVVGRKLRKMMPWLKAKEPPK